MRPLAVFNSKRHLSGAVFGRFQGKFFRLARQKNNRYYLAGADFMPNERWRADDANAGAM